MTDDPPRPPWYGTARYPRRRDKPARPAPRVFTAEADPEKVLDSSQWIDTGEGRGENGLFVAGNPGGPGFNSGPVLRLKRRLKQIIDDDHPDLMRDVVKELAHIALEGETHGDRLKAIQLLMDRYWGKLREHKTINRVGAASSSVNIALFGDLAWLNEQIKDPEARYAIARRIHEHQQLEHPTVVEVIPDGQCDQTEDSAGPGSSV